MIGAEATLTRKGKVMRKERVSKGYRLTELDSKIRKSRTRREAKVLSKLSGEFSPKLISTDNESVIEMEYIVGERLVDVLESKKYVPVCSAVGEIVASLHNKEIIHGDLTTSNMILRDKEVVLIDFGLSYFSKRIEDKAVDLHLFRQALESKHHEIWEKCFSSFLKAYQKKAKEGTLIVKRLDVVEGRGRNKGK